MRHRFTPEQAAYLKEHITGSTRKNLTGQFNKHFDLQLSLSQITAYLKNNGLKSGVDARFHSNQIPHNKGKKGTGGWAPTQFKTGHKPHNHKPVGTERINTVGYVDVKIAEPNKWRAKHLWVWEEANGPVPKGHVVIFGDGNRHNFEPGNLILVSRKQLVVLNKNNLIQGDADLTRTGIAVADIYMKIAQLKKG